MRVALVDDTLIELKQLEKLLNKYTFQYPSQNLEITPFSNPDDFLRFFSLNPVFDLIFLDMVMPFFNGIEVGKEIRKTDTMVKIIYTTISPEYAIEAYDVKAYHYLLKPVSETALFKVLNEVILINEKIQERSLSIKDRDSIINLAFSKLLYVEVDKHHIYYHLKDQSVISTYSTLKEVLLQLSDDPGFIKVHQSFIVNLSSVIALQNHALLLPNNRIIPISRSLYTQVKDKYIQYLAQHGKRP
jgi:DNA-binding LytR/AlgR family response regulator